MFELIQLRLYSSYELYIYHNNIIEVIQYTIYLDQINMDLGDYFDTYNHEEEFEPRIFGLLFNSSNLISPAYAAAIVLGISFGIAALAGLLYYSLIGGFDSGGGYGGSSGYGSFFSSRRFIWWNSILSMYILILFLNQG